VPSKKAEVSNMARTGDVEKEIMRDFNWCVLSWQNLVKLHGCLKQRLRHGLFEANTKQRIKTNLVMVSSNYSLT